MLCEAATTANSDVFELVVAQNTAIYSVFEPAVKKHRNLRRIQQHGRQTHCYLQFAFSRKDVKPQQSTKTLQTSISAQQKSRKPSPKQLQNLPPPRPPDKTH